MVKLRLELLSDKAMSHKRLCIRDVSKDGCNVQRPVFVSQSFIACFVLFCGTHEVKVWPANISSWLQAIACRYSCNSYTI